MKYRTIYISKKWLNKNLFIICSSYRDRVNTFYFLRNYPEVKYFYIDKKTGVLKPSKRKK